MTATRDQKDLGVERYEPDADDPEDRERAALAQIGAETVAVASAGAYDAPSGARVHVADLVGGALAGTRAILDASALVVRARELAARKERSRTAVEVTAERTGDAARRVLLREGARRVALLNFANGVRHGGGFLYGARAQEEHLCRCSALYPCLISARAQPFYVENIASGSALVTDALIVSPSVPFFRDDTSLVLLDEPFVATVITAAAPDLGWLFAQVDSNIVPPVDDAAMRAIFERRARAIVAAAVDDGADALVLGAWGCGAFGNDPALVADAFALALDDVGAALARVVFAVWPPGSKNFGAFDARFRR